MDKKFVDHYLWALEFLSNQYKTQEIHEKAVEIAPWLLEIVSD